MSGELNGSTDSAVAVITAVFTYSAAFDTGTKSRLTVADQSDHAAQALFTATVHGVPVIGIASVALGDAGGDVSVFYDYPESFAASFPRLREIFNHGADSAATLTPLKLADGSTIRVLPGWRIIGQGEGLVDLAGPQGEFASLGDVMPVYAGPAPFGGAAAQGPCCDPVAAFRGVFPALAANALHRGMPPQNLMSIVETAKAPAPTGGQGAFLLSNVNVGGRSYSDFALAYAIGGFVDPWVFRLSRVSAPQSVFAAELPVLLQIWGSFSANELDLAQRLYDSARGFASLRAGLPSAPAPLPVKAAASGGWDAIVPQVAARMSEPQIDIALTEELVQRLSAESGNAWHVVQAAAAN